MNARRGRWIGLAGMGLVGVVAAACTDEEPTDAAYTPDPDCFGVEVAGLSDDELECGTVTVPLHHDQPDGEEIRLAVAVLAGDDDAPDAPTLLLGGGPGEVMIETVLGEPMAQQLFTTGRQLILLDQRGVGSSSPSLACPDPPDEVFDDVMVEDTEAVLDVYRSCRQHLVSEGIDLDAFNHRNNALDIDHIRAALGHDQLDIRGGSYGSHLALHAAALNPEGVRSLILSSPVDPSTNYAELAAGGFDAALDRVVAACAATRSCDQAVGDLDTAIDEVVARLDEAPEEITVQPPDGEETTETYGPAGFLNGLFLLFYLPDGPFALPALVADARDGDLEPLAEIVALVEQELQGAATAGMQVSMVFSGEGSVFDERTARDRVGSATIEQHWFPYDLVAGGGATRLCDLWDVKPSFDPAEFSYPSGVPALVVTGELDHVTPSAHGERIVERLDTAYLVEVPSVGHGPLEALSLFTEACGEQIVEAFLADPRTGPDTTCVGQMPTFEPLGQLPALP